MSFDADNPFYGDDDDIDLDAMGHDDDILDEDEYFEEDDEYDDLDGDHESGFSSAGWGIDESYGHYGDDDE